MDDVCNRITTWLAFHVPKLLETFKEGASNAEILKTETIIGVNLPEEVKQYFSIRNGQKDVGGFLGNRRFLSLERVVEVWRGWMSIVEDDIYFSENFVEFEIRSDSEIRASYFDRRWIPLTEDGSGNIECLDLNPTEGGSVGQIISVFHDDNQRTVVAKSLFHLLKQLSEDLESDKYVLGYKQRNLEKIK